MASVGKYRRQNLVSVQNVNVKSDIRCDLSLIVYGESAVVVQLKKLI